MNKLKSNVDELTDLEDLKKEIKKIKQIEIELKKIFEYDSMDIFLKKIKNNELIEQMSNIKSRIIKGIPIKCKELKNKIINDIIEYLIPYGYTKEFILMRLENIRFSITDEKLISGGLLSYTNNKINIDYSLAVFDNQGRFIKFKEEKEDFLRYVITHEFLHALSIPNTNKYLTHDALSEGYTDFFAHIISNNFIDKSVLYDFSVRICTLLANMVGIDKTLDDYINNLTEFSNLRNFFYSQGLDDSSFYKFYILMNNIIELQIKKDNQSQIKKVELLEFIKDNLLISFLKTEEVNKENYIKLFNELFSEFDITCSFEEMKSITK